MEMYHRPRTLFCHAAKGTRTIELRGERNPVLQVAGEVNKILSQVISSGLDLDHIKRTGSRKEYLKAFSSSADVIAPRYWRKYHGSLSGESSTQGKLSEVNDKLTKSITDLVMKTWNASVVGQGNDAQNLRHSKIKVRKVYVVENPSLYRRYISQMKELYKQKPYGVPKIVGLKKAAEIDTLLKGNFANFPCN